MLRAIYEPKLLNTAAMVLTESEDPKTLGKEIEEIRLILEDTTSPVTRKYHELLMQSVVQKAHINFDDIARSAGVIRNYSGYNTMVDTLQVMKELTISSHQKQTKDDLEILKYVETIQKAIEHIDELRTAYETGFTRKSSYVMLEYCTYTYTCVEATTALIYQYVEFIKAPDAQTLQITLRNSKMRANLFYFEQLAKFNQMMDTSGVTYRNMLNTMANGDKNNFFGADDAMVVGSTAIIAAAVMIIPVTRELIYHFYHLRGKLAKSLELQATFLEMNKTCVEANQAFTPEKKKKILQKQEKLKNNLLKISEVLRVKAVTATKKAKDDIKKDNQKLTVDGIRNDVSSSPMSVELF